MATISKLPYTLALENKVKWSETHEKALSTDFPLETFQESTEQFVYRTYLQFLWLPHSIMPIEMFVPTMKRVEVASASNIHPLHRLLDDLLLTPLVVTTKYHQELPRILLNGGGAGEMEEAMMWYAVTHEKGEIDEPWMDAKWRSEWLERMERREVQIQILMYYLKMSLPGPVPKPKRKGKRKRTDSPEPELEDYVESFSDKLSTWQLLASLAEKQNLNTGERQRDWTQVFCEDIIESEFKGCLPSICEMLRSKVFPHSPFADSDSEASTTRASSPEEDAGAPSFSPPAKATSRELARARSRSLSVSLAQEHQERTSSVGAGPKKRAVIREISMSRAFKPKPKVAPSQLVAQTQSQKDNQLPPKGKEKDLGLTLVEDTPVRSKSFSLNGGSHPAGLARNLSTAFSSSKPLFDVADHGILAGGMGRGRTASKTPLADENDDDDNWQIESSPDILLLSPPKAEFGMDTEMDMDGDEPPTPSKPSTRKFARR